IYQLALNLTKITALDEAAAWGAQLHESGTIYRDWMNQKTFTTDPATRQRTWSWTHERTRKAYNSLNHLWRNQLLFVYLDPPDGVLDVSRIKSTTNSLEGGINAQLKRIADAHRGRSGERQRKMLEWYLHSKTQLPDDPLKIARQCNYGQDQLAKVNDLVPEDHNKADHETGRPAF
ncbi:IS256 family transposase, partial [Enterococcus faecium]|nr:IS256 family transposase [Enterococcus faecium]